MTDDVSVTPHMASALFNGVSHLEETLSKRANGPGFIEELQASAAGESFERYPDELCVLRYVYGPQMVPYAVALVKRDRVCITKALYQLEDIYTSRIIKDNKVRKFVQLTLIVSTLKLLDKNFNNVSDRSTGELTVILSKPAPNDWIGYLQGAGYRVGSTRARWRAEISKRDPVRTVVRLADWEHKRRSARS